MAKSKSSPDLVGSKHGKKSKSPKGTHENSALVTPHVEVAMIPVGKLRYRVEVKLGDVTVTDEINPYRITDRTRLIKKLADLTKLSKNELSHLDQLLPKKAAEVDAAIEQDSQALSGEDDANAADDQQAATEQILAETPKEIIDKAMNFLTATNMFELLTEDFDALGIVGEKPLATAIYVVGTSRQLDQPLGAIVKAASSSGKSFVSNKVIDLMPPEQVFRATDISPQALYYLEPGSLTHKLVSVAERKHGNANDDPAHANSGLALREMLSSGVLRKAVADRGSDGLTTRVIEQKGPIAYVETTTQEVVLEEDENRLLQLTTDESKEQTDRIINHVAKCEAAITTDTNEQESIRQKHQTAQRLLKPLKVRIPFAELLSVPTDKVTARRAFGQLLTYIKAVALLRQYRKKAVDGVINATVQDYKIAYSVMHPVLQRTFAPLNERARKLFDKINENIAKTNGKFDRNDCCKWLGLSLTEVRTRLEMLIAAGLIYQRDANKQGRKAAYQLTCQSEIPSAAFKGMVSPAKLREKLNNQKAVKKPESKAG